MVSLLKVRGQDLVAELPTAALHALGLARSTCEQNSTVTARLCGTIQCWLILGAEDSWLHPLGGTMPGALQCHGA